MKTFLEQCKDVCREAGLAGGELAIDSVTGQTGQVGRIVAYVRQSWLEVQNLHQHSGLYWRWMRSEFELTTVASQDIYAYGDAAVQDVQDTPAAITRFRNWMIRDYRNPPRIYNQASGIGSQSYLTYVDWDDFRLWYRMGQQNPSFPVHITINPQNKIVLGPSPNDVYVINGDYMKAAQVLTANDDMPDLPESFQEVIMYKALSKYGVQKNASESIVAGEDGAATYLGALEGDQLSEIPIGSPLC